MNFLRTLLLITSFATLMLFSGCSDLFQKDEPDKNLELDTSAINCELNVDEFSLIMEEAIPETIQCLGRNLKYFIKNVESKRPGFLSRIALENYLRRHRKDIKPEAVNALKAVFDINFLVYGEDREFISEENVDALVKFAIIFNEKASSNFKPIFVSDARISYDQYRLQRDERVKPAALIIAKALKDIFRENRKGEIHELNLIHLLDSFTAGGNRDSISKVKSLLFVKKILLGGSREIITHEELYKLIENFSSYTLLALDVIKFSKVNSNEESVLQLLHSDFELLNTLIFSSFQSNRSNEKFFTLREAIKAYKLIFTDSKIDFDKYYDLMKEAKLLILEGDPNSPEVVTGGDLGRFFKHGLHLLKTGKLFYRYWNIERKALETDRPVTEDFSELIRTNRNELPIVKKFVRIVKDYRFMKGKFKSAYYTDAYKRNAAAAYEIAIYEYIIHLVMNKYGCPKNTLQGSVECNSSPTGQQEHWGKDYVYMKKEHVVSLVLKFRSVLLDAGLVLPGREIKVAETITLLGSLFQYQSDKNRVFDVNEATEFAISLFTSINITKNLINYFENSEGCQMDKYGRVSPTCFKKRFFEGVCRNYPDHFPKLFSSLGATVYESDPERPGSRKLVCKIPSSAANEAYLNRTIEAARSCHVYPGTDEEIYYSKGEITAVMLAMMHIETTIIRWDVRNHNNVMDPAEVNDAYSIYSPALDGFLKKMPGFVKKLKKQIYQYLVKYEEIPNADSFSNFLRFKFFLLSFNKKATANRKTIASILVAIGDQGTPAQVYCEDLRDPTTMLENYERRTKPPASAALTPTLRAVNLTPEDALLVNEIESSSDSLLERNFKEFWPSF